MRHLLSIGFLSIALPLVLSGATGCQKKEAPAKGSFIKGKDGENLNAPPQVAQNPPPGDGTAQAEPPKAKEAPRPKDVKGQGKSLIQSIRGAATRPQRSNELKQIGIFFVSHVDELKKKPASEEEFIKYLGNPGAALAQPIRDKHYVLNLKVNMKDSNDVIAWEAVNEGGNFMVVRVSTVAELVPESDLEVILGLRKP